jgi:hypothetical protein
MYRHQRRTRSWRSIRAGQRATPGRSCPTREATRRKTSPGRNQIQKMQTPPGGVQMLRKGLQHTSPAPHTTSPQRSKGTQRAFPLSAMHCVPMGQSTAAQGLVCSTQIPPQSAPPDFGSQSSDGSSMHVCPSGHGMPAMPPQKAPAGAHSPRLATATPAAAALQAFGYVTPSQPQTGSNS